jgi:hypothetical protein
MLAFSCSEQWLGKSKKDLGSLALSPQPSPSLSAIQREKVNDKF